MAFAALLLAALYLILALRPAPRAPSRPSETVHAAALPAPGGGRALAPPPAAPVTQPAPEQDELPPIPPGTPTHRNALGAGDGTGIYAFPLAGTKPLRRGLIVPDGFVLPPGYVRHYQTSDDGHAMPPILMFHPDHHPVDAKGQPIPLPADLVVPPELAPPGMPLDPLDPGPVHADLDDDNKPL